MHFETSYNEIKCVLSIKVLNFNVKMGKIFSLTVKYPFF